MSNRKNWYNKTFSSVKHFGADFAYGVHIGSEYIRYPIHKGRQGIDSMDKYIQHGSKVPLLNDTIALLTDNPLYAEALGLIRSTDKTFEDISNISKDSAFALGFSPYSNQQNVYGFNHAWTPDTPRVAFDAGFITSRGDIARTRGEPQIDGAVDVSTDFGRTNNPSQTSAHNRGGDSIGGGHIPAGQAPPDEIHYAPNTGIIGADTFSGNFEGAINPAPAPTPQVPDDFEQFLPGPTPPPTPAPSQTTS